LRRGAGTRKVKENTVLEKKVPIFVVVKFTTVVTLNKTYWEKEVRVDIVLKIEK
jgi:hypothetical protein